MKWNNLFSYSEGNEIDLSSDKVTQIVGFNGAGKSSIPTIMEEGLYNKNSKGFKKADIPNRHISKPYSIYIQFLIDEDVYDIDIKKASTLKATLTKNGDDISKNTASGTIKLVEELLSMEFKTFTQLVYQNTESSLQFLTATDSKRKEFLVSLFDLSEYGEKQKIFADALKSVQTRLSVIESGMKSTASAIAMTQRNLTLEIDELLEEPEENDELYTELGNLQSAKKDLDSYNQKVQNSNAALKAYESAGSIEEYENKLASLEEPENYQDKANELAEINSEIRSAKAIVDKLDKVGNNCPTCLQPVDKSFVSSLRQENETILTEKRALGSQLVKAIEDAKKTETLIKSIESRIEKIKTLQSRVESTQLLEEKSLADIQDSIKSIQLQINAQKVAVTQIREHNKKVYTNQAKLESAQEQITQLESQLKEQEDQFKIVEQDIGPLEVLKKAFGNTGLITYKLENRVKDLEKFTNFYLANLSDGRFNLSFELENDKLNVVIYDEGVPVSITALSSGEKARVVIGTLLGIRKIMASIAKTTINVLFLDEVISVMDDEGKEQLVEVLLQEEGLNTFLVSHSWAHPLVRKLEVKKDVDGISRIYGQ